MTPIEILILIAVIYSVIGGLCFLFSAFADCDWREMLFAYFCWPVIAYYGLRMLIERLRADIGGGY